ncbi:MAG: DUF4328 domain-containing protein [Chloroflexi bacterium]|jgi:hypothetical protein|nr:DUF4328 domain-containing protein [Chloroflexota bacterium]
MTDGALRWPDADDGPPRTAPGREGTWASPGYRSSHVRGRAVLVILAAIALADLIAIRLDLGGVVLMAEAEAGTLTEETAVAFDQLHAAVGLLQTGLLVASAVAFLAWLSRVVDNVPPLTGRTPQRGPRAAIGWWFVPVATLVVPFMIVSDTARRLRPTSDGMGLVLPAWWALWLATSNLGILLVRMPTDTIDDLRTAYLTFALTDLLDAIAALLLVVVVWRIERWSRARAAQVGIGPAARAPADPKEAYG